MDSATVVIPTTGADELKEAIESVLDQSHKNVSLWVVIDGHKFKEKSIKVLKKFPQVKSFTLPENTGANGYNGHRIYGAVSYLINSDFILYLDEDNWYKKDHVKDQIQLCLDKQLDWSYSLRSIYTKDKQYLFDDNCESLGRYPVFSNNYHLVDTNCYCVRKNVAVAVSPVWHRQIVSDRELFIALNQYFPKYDSTGRYTVGYRLGNTERSVNQNFFIRGNKIMSEKYPDGFPWVDKSHESL